MVSTPCPSTRPTGKPCGSYYRNGDTCNICGTLQPAPPNAGPLPDGNAPFFTTTGHAPRGLGWDKSQHRVTYK